MNGGQRRCKGRACGEGKTHIVDAPAQIEEDALSEFAPINTVVLAQLLARDAGRVDVEQHALIVRARLDHVAPVRDEVVQRREHL
jgi:hypothetical protein